MSNKSKQQLVLIIPVFNEASRLQASLDLLGGFFADKQYLHKLCLVDDGSSDDTVDIINEFVKKKLLPIELVQNKVNLGKGASIKKVMKKYANFDGYLAYTDADLPYGLEVLEDCKQLLDERKADLVIGNRESGGDSRGQYSRYRYFFKKVFKMMLSKKLREYNDTQSGIKMFNNKITSNFNKVFSDKWCFDLELILLAENNQLLVKELPIVLREAPSNGGVSFLRHGLSVISELIKIRIRDFNGAYQFEKK